ncbi:flagellar hook capping protein [Alsobacter soli]|uniref:Basal-body rod modification protein FlgD n=1 Tax=Alsobacter soli TaxID=2109933 RepID=A0A2T1HZ77_9HYPH|nr:flagellar hook capping FlgD N-terminal domain-containing protein [Alsobacter soli]PSC06888.1 flagellar hook capping protein [Alsobacter soli]
MTTVGSTSSSSSTSSTSSSSSDKSMLANNFDQFLLLLTTQLKNQNPLDPLDTNQFTQQLVQFASVEQQIKTNTQLTSLLAATKASTATNALNFVGSTITADGATAHLSNGSATWSLNAAKAAQATISVKNSSGDEVYSLTKSLSAGAQTFTWDGTSNSGVKLGDGDYTISVSAKDTSGTGVTVTTQIQGVVDSVDLTSDVPMLKIGGVSVPINNVLTMRKSGT